MIIIFKKALFFFVYLHMDLNLVSKKDKYWREIAFNYSKDKMLADDLVQDMYLKMLNVKKPVNDWYIIYAIRNLWLDHCRKKSKSKTLLLDDISILKSNESDFEPTDEEYELLLRANNIKYHQREFLEENYNNSIRKIGEKYKVNYGFVYQELKKAREYIRYDIQKRDYKLTTKITEL